jgi:hypothetical protein
MTSPVPARSQTECPGAPKRPAGCSCVRHTQPKNLTATFDAAARTIPLTYSLFSCINCTEKGNHLLCTDGVHESKVVYVENRADANAVMADIAAAFTQTVEHIQVFTVWARDPIGPCPKLMHMLNSQMPGGNVHMQCQCGMARIYFP